MMEEDDVSLHGIVLAAGLTATVRVMQSDKAQEYPPRGGIHQSSLRGWLHERFSACDLL
jgi:hypothetical protein